MNTLETIPKHTVTPPIPDKAKGQILVCKVPGTRKIERFNNGERIYYEEVPGIIEKVYHFAHPDRMPAGFDLTAFDYLGRGRKNGSIGNECESKELYHFWRFKK